VEEFDWDVKIDRMLDLYAEAVRSFTRRSGGRAA